jgi:hypothetical protein
VELVDAVDGVGSAAVVDGRVAAAEVVALYLRVVLAEEFLRGC